MQEVTTTRTITVGNRFRIHPTEAWLGIDRGMIEVVGIAEGFSDIQEDIREGLPRTEYEALLSLHDEGTDDYDELLDILESQPWIVYKYTSFLCRTPEATLNEVIALPLFVFEGSITSY